MEYKDLILCLMRLPYPYHISDIGQDIDTNKAFFTWRNQTYSVSLESIMVGRKMNTGGDFFIGDNEAILMEYLLKRILTNLKTEDSHKEE